MGTFICPDDSWVLFDGVVRSIKTWKARCKDHVCYDITLKEPMPLGDRVCRGWEGDLIGKTPEAIEKVLNDPKWVLEALCEGWRRSAEKTGESEAA